MEKIAYAVALDTVEELSKIRTSPAQLASDLSTGTTAELLFHSDRVIEFIGSPEEMVIIDHRYVDLIDPDHDFTTDTNITHFQSGGDFYLPVAE